MPLATRPALDERVKLLPAAQVEVADAKTSTVGHLQRLLRGASRSCSMLSKIRGMPSFPRSCLSPRGPGAASCPHSRVQFREVRADKPRHAMGPEPLPLRPAFRGVTGYARVGGDAINAHPLLVYHQHGALGAHCNTSKVGSSLRESAPLDNLRSLAANGSGGRGYYGPACLSPSSTAPTSPWTSPGAVTTNTLSGA